MHEIFEDNIGRTLASLGGVLNNTDKRRLENEELMREYYYGDITNEYYYGNDISDIIKNININSDVCELGELTNGVDDNFDNFDDLINKVESGEKLTSEEEITWDLLIDELGYLINN